VFNRILKQEYEQNRVLAKLHGAQEEDLPHFDEIESEVQQEQTVDVNMLKGMGFTVKRNG
jgi:hypothetical protein